MEYSTKKLSQDLGDHYWVVCIMSNSTSEEEGSTGSTLRVEMKGNLRNNQQRRAAGSAAAVLSCVGCLFVLGLFLFFRSMYIYSQQQILHEMLRRKTAEESSSSTPPLFAREETPIVKPSNGHFNVSFLVDNTPSGGTKGLVIITVMPELAPLGARRYT